MDFLKAMGEEVDFRGIDQSLNLEKILFRFGWYELLMYLIQHSLLSQFSILGWLSQTGKAIPKIKNLKLHLFGLAKSDWQGPSQKIKIIVVMNAKLHIPSQFTACIVQYIQSLSGKIMQYLCDYQPRVCNGFFQGKLVTNPANKAG